VTPSKIVEFGENLFLVEGPLVQTWGVRFPTRMIVVRLTSGQLWINSPVEVSPETLATVLSWGEPAYFVAPTRLHVWRLVSWHQRFPQAEIWAAPQIPKAFRNLPFAGQLGDTPSPAWSNDLEQRVFRGNILIEEVFFYHRHSRSLILADFIQNYPPVPGHPINSLLKRWAGVVAPNGGVPIDIRMTFWHRQAARNSLRAILAWDFVNVIIAHGDCVHTYGRHFFERAFAWLQD